jgi:hypothetical protein
MVTPEQTTKAKQRALTQGVKEWVLEPGRWYVALSRTQEGLAYEISLHGRGEGDISCSCPGATHRGICLHPEGRQAMVEPQDRQVRQFVVQGVLN